MPQLYCQLSSRPNPWLLGRTSAGLCTLHVACPLTVTYSGGSPAADTIAAGSAATVYGGSAVAFDASGDVWVVLTVPGSGALQVTKEADLALVTGDWAGLARIAQHAVEPYQPQAYLAAGGLGGAPGTTTTLASTAGAEQVYDLGHSGTYLGEPSGWQNVGFVDSGWTPSVLELSSPTLLAGAHWVGISAGDVAGSEILLVRRDFVLPTGVVQTASLQVSADAEILGVWVNGTPLFSGDDLLWPIGGSPSALTVALPVADLVPGAANVLALKTRNGSTDATLHGPTGCQYLLVITSGSTGGVADPGGHEGDLLYFHSGAWVDLPIGTSGQVLRSDGTDPGWATPGSGAGVGTVTSVAFSGPTGTTTGGSPITTSGTLSLSWASQSANTVLGAPSGSSGAPTFRALVGADIPVDASTIVVSSGTIKGNYQAGSGVSISGNTISATGSGGSVTSVALTVPGIFSVSGSPVTTSGTLAVSLATQSAHTVFAGPASGSAATPTFRTLQSADLPATAGSGGNIHAHGHFH